MLCNNNNTMSDEFHFLFECVDLTELTNKYIPRYYSIRPNAFKLEQMLSYPNNKLVLNVAKYISKCLALSKWIMLVLYRYVMSI